MSTTYVILLPGSETAYAQASDDDRAAIHTAHGTFATALAERGHAVLGGAQLAPSADARTVRPGPDGPVVSEGPFAETAEQLTGYYLVETGDLDGLLDTCGILASVGHAVEVRGCLGMGEDS